MTYHWGRHPNRTDCILQFIKWPCCTVGSSSMSERSNQSHKQSPIYWWLFMCLGPCRAASWQSSFLDSASSSRGMRRCCLGLRFSNCHRRKQSLCKLVSQRSRFLDLSDFVSSHHARAGTASSSDSKLIPNACGMLDRREMIPIA